MITITLMNALDCVLEIATVVDESEISAAVIRLSKGMMVGDKIVIGTEE